MLDPSTPHRHYPTSSCIPNVPKKAYVSPCSCASVSLPTESTNQPLCPLPLTRRTQNTSHPHLKTRLNQLDPTPLVPHLSHKLWYQSDFARTTRAMLDAGGEQAAEARERTVFLSMLCEAQGTGAEMMATMAPDEEGVDLGAEIRATADAAAAAAFPGRGGGGGRARRGRTGRRR